jgi:hypothetical protein
VSTGNELGRVWADRRGVHDVLEPDARVRSERNVRAVRCRKRLSFRASLQRWDVFDRLFREHTMQRRVLRRHDVPTGERRCVVRHHGWRLCVLFGEHAFLQRGFMRRVRNGNRLPVGPSLLPGHVLEQLHRLPLQRSVLLRWLLLRQRDLVQTCGTPGL